MDDTFRDDIAKFTYAQYCDKKLDDHEERLRHIEKNNKVALELKAFEERVFLKFDANEHLYLARIESLDKYVVSQMAVLGEKKAIKIDIISLISLVMSVATFIILILTKVI